MTESAKPLEIEFSPEFRLLNAIRNRSVTDDDLGLFNRRYDPLFEPPENEFHISLTSVNQFKQ